MEDIPTKNRKIIGELTDEIHTTLQRFNLASVSHDVKAGQIQMGSTQLEGVVQEFIRELDSYIKGKNESVKSLLHASMKSLPLFLSYKIPDKVEDVTNTHIYNFYRNYIISIITIYNNNNDTEIPEDVKVEILKYITDKFKKEELLSSEFGTRGGSRKRRMSSPRKRRMSSPRKSKKRSSKTTSKRSYTKGKGGGKKRGSKKSKGKKKKSQVKRRNKK
jgi:hypothetical protein